MANNDVTDVVADVVEASGVSGGGMAVVITVAAVAGAALWEGGKWIMRKITKKVKEKNDKKVDPEIIEGKVTVETPKK